MACSHCENVLINGPTLVQQYIDPFSTEPAHRWYRCPQCQQRYWDSNDGSGYWVRVDDEETVLAIINNRPITIQHNTAIAISVLRRREAEPLPPA